MKKHKLYRNFKVGFFGFILINLIFAITGSNALAHKVNLLVYVEGDKIYTESTFPDGKKVEDGVIEVYDSQGKKLLEGKTSKDGLFSFKIPKKDDLTIVLTASMGHKATYSLKKEDL